VFRYDHVGQRAKLSETNAYLLHGSKSGEGFQRVHRPHPRRLARQASPSGLDVSGLPGPESDESSQVAGGQDFPVNVYAAVVLGPDQGQARRPDQNVLEIKDIVRPDCTQVVGFLGPSCDR
jgi:hypothetical protein